MSELVSVIITTYKRPEKLSRAIESVLNQDYSNIEILVVDDNNPDTDYRVETELIMKKYKDNRKVNYIKHKENLNGATARNTGIKLSKGKYISFLDDDDTYRISKISTQVEFLEKNTEFDVCYCGWSSNKVNYFPKSEGDLTYELIGGDVVILTNSIMVKRTKATEVKGFNELFTRNQEAVFLLRLFKAGAKIGAVSEILIDYDLEDRSNVANPAANEKNFMQFINSHIEQLKGVSSRRNLNYKKPISKRYREIIFKYLHHGMIKEAFSFYFKHLFESPIWLNYYIFKYIIDRRRNTINSTEKWV